MNFQILGLHSELMAPDFIREMGESFISRLEASTGIVMEWVHSPDEFREDAIPVIFIQTGGTEGVFQELFEKIPQPAILLTHGEMNSLAASLEILAYLQQRGLKGEVIHGEPEYVRDRLINLQKVQEARIRLSNAKLGVIGRPSDWLIASQVEKGFARERLGCEIIDIPITELIELSQKDYEIDEPLVKELQEKPFKAEEMKKALNIYGALCELIERYRLNGLTVRCFDLLGTLHSTACIGLALLNAKGIPSACEGDVPALISTMILQYLLGEPGFMVNPSRINVNDNSMVVAHCTLPLNMGGDYTLKTHFESGIGVAVDGKLPKQDGLMFKVDPDLGRYFLSEIQVTANLSEENLCRTQIEIKLKEDVRYFLNEPCANHHIIALNNDTALIQDFMDVLI
jgi:L-fucose isomerase-like protein